MSCSRVDSPKLIYGGEKSGTSLRWRLQVTPSLEWRSAVESFAFVTQLSQPQNRFRNKFKLPYLEFTEKSVLRKQAWFVPTSSVEAIFTGFPVETHSDGADGALQREGE